jgi:hypothetical protein
MHARCNFSVQSATQKNISINEFFFLFQLGKKNKLLGFFYTETRVSHFGQSKKAEELEYFFLERKRAARPN